ncbi:hypothetical protein [Arthrobacter sp. TMS2-4]
MTGNDQNDRLTPQQQQAVIELALCNNTGKAAVRAGVTERTIRRWIHQPPFRAAFREQARQNSEQSLEALRAAQLQAVNVLWEQLNDDSETVKFRAASRLLEAGIQLREQDVDERLSELERGFTQQMLDQAEGGRQ